MPSVRLTAALQAEYQQLFDTCQVRQPKALLVEKAVDSLLANQPRYRSVGDPLNIPWYVIAVIHNMECSQNFSQHLHNGDPLTARTSHVPAGRPRLGNPPFRWEDSATDALQQRNLQRWEDWSIAGILYCLEGYNGWGYRSYHPAVKSPYLWSGSNHYTAGKYVADGTWSDTAVSSQLGAATLLRRLAEKGAFALNQAPSNHASAGPVATQPASSAPVFAYAPNTVNPSGIALQQFFNRMPGIFLKEDGKLGEKSSNACKAVFGFYLAGDPRT